MVCCRSARTALTGLFELSGFKSLHSYFDFLEYTEILPANPIPKFRRRYLKHIKQHKGPNNTRQLISVPAMAQLVYTTQDPTDQQGSIH